MRDARSEAAHQRRKIADARRQQRLNAFAQTPRQNRRRAAGADRDHNVTAINDGGENESRKLRPVDDVDRHAVRARPCGDGGVPRIAGGTHDGDEIGEIRDSRI